MNTGMQSHDTVHQSINHMVQYMPGVVNAHGQAVLNRQKDVHHE